MWHHLSDLIASWTSFIHSLATAPPFLCQYLIRIFLLKYTPKYINKNNIQQGIDLLDKNCMIGFSMSCNVLADYYLEKQQDKAKFIYYSRHFYNQHCQRYNNADNSCTFAKEFEKL